MTDVTELDLQDILSRAQRSREALGAAIGRTTDEVFGRKSPDHWSVAQIVRHVVWVEHYWLALARKVREHTEPVLDLGEPDVRRHLALEASRLAGTSPEPLPEPPPYEEKPQAMQALADADATFRAFVTSLRPNDLQRCFSHPQRGTSSFRFALEHIIEHDWDHALQVTGVEPTA